MGVDVEAGRHTLRVVSGRLASASLHLDLLPDQAVTVTVDRGPDRHEVWTLTAQPTPDGGV